MSSTDKPKLPFLEQPAVCTLLRCKSAYSPIAGGTGWRHGDSTTEAYWCLSTMEAFGPDDDLVHAHHCRSGRRCWQEPDYVPDDD